MRSLGAPEGALGSARSRVCNCYPVILLVGRKAQTGPRRRKHYKNLHARHQELDAVHRHVCIPLLSSDSSGLILLSGVPHVLRWQDTWTAGQSGAATNSSPAPAAAALAWGRQQVTAFLLTRYLQAPGLQAARLPAHLFLLQQGKGVCQQRHPEGARSNVSRHQHQQQLGSFGEPLLAVQPVELPVLPYTRCW